MGFAPREHQAAVSVQLSSLTMASKRKAWNVKFLHGNEPTAERRYGLIILNQPFSLALLRRLWASTQWHCCADGGANRLYDSFPNERDRARFVPPLQPRA